MDIRRSRLATIVASATVLVALLMPGDEVPKVELPYVDKVVHVLLFGFWALALRFDWEGFRRRPILLIAAVAIAGPLTETLQLLAPDRSFDLLDMAADLVGAALAAALGAPLVGLADRLIGAPVSRASR